MVLAKKDLKRYIIQKVEYGKYELNLVRTGHGNNWKIEHTISKKEKTGK